MGNILSGTEAPMTSGVRQAQSNLDMINGRMGAIAKEAAWLGASFIPVAGSVIDVGMAIGNAWSGNWGAAGLDLIGAIPGYGDGIKGTAKGTKLAAMLTKLGKQADAAKAALASQKSIARTRAAAQKFWKSQKEKAYAQYQKDLKKCNGSAACKKKAEDKYKEERFGRVPRDGEGGNWVGDRGNGKWVPTKGTELDKALKKYGRDGVEFRDGHPDFSPFTQKATNGAPARVEVPNLQGNHTTDMTAAHQAARDQFGSWSRKQADSTGTWHHEPDGVTMSLIDKDVHGGVAHAGSASMLGGSGQAQF